MSKVQNQSTQNVRSLYCCTVMVFQSFCTDKAYIIKEYDWVLEYIQGCIYLILWLCSWFIVFICIH